MTSLESSPERRVKDEKFFETLRGLPPKAQDLLTGLSSQLLETDIYRKFKADERNIHTLKKRLKRLRLGPDQVQEVMDYFNLPTVEK